MKGLILITGASSGIGKALAEKFYSNGWTVIAAARRIKLLSVKDLNKGGKGKYIPLKLDITNKNEVKKSFKKSFTKLGFPDIIVLNAGTNNPNSKNIVNIDEIKNIYNVNFFGTINCIQTILDLVKIKKKPSQMAIVSSVAGYRGLPYASAYCSSKSALINFAESIYHQCRHIGINIRLINPGFIKTPLTDKNKFTMPMIITSNIAANIIYKKLLHSKSFEISLPRLFCFVMKVLRLIPYSIYFRITARLIKKL